MDQKLEKTNGRKKVLKKPMPEEESTEGIKSIEQLVEITQLQNKVLQSILKKQDEILKTNK